MSIRRKLILISCVVMLLLYVVAIIHGVIETVEFTNSFIDQGGIFLDLDMDTWTREQALEFLDSFRDEGNWNLNTLSHEQRMRLLEILRTFENPNAKPLTPEQLFEYIALFHLEVDISEDQILAGEEFILTATDETSEILFGINFFTNGLHEHFRERLPLFEPIALTSMHTPITHASLEFTKDYLHALRVKEHYTGWLTEHWSIISDYYDVNYYIDFPFLRLEHVVHFPAEMYWFYMNLPYEIQRRVHIEVNGLSLPRFLELIWTPIFAWDSGPWIEFDGSGKIIRGRTDTDDVLAERSTQFWTNPVYSREKEMMQELGLSGENPITFEWVIANPKDAHAIFISHPFRRFENVRYGNPDDDWFMEHGIPILPPWFKAAG